MDSPSASVAVAAATNAMQAVVEISTDGVPKLHCPICNKALVSLNGYVKHVQKHEPPGGFLCRYCEARYCTEDELKRHRDAVHTTIACRLCKGEAAITFTNASDYREHIRTEHDGVDREMLKCDKCGAEYKTIDPFRRHMETQCGTIKPHKCDQCSMSFVTKYNLKQHKESHSGERKFCCSYCGKNFLQKGRLVEHERSHTGEKPYKCDVCGKCFAHRESIVTHSSIHTGIRLVECRCCQSRFSCHSNLIKHRRTRPDTCGQPEYDPPRNRVRTHRSRIPATLNPTSEIKVSSFNKIIKPDDMEHFKKTAPPPRVKENRKTKATARKRTGLPPVAGPRKTKPAKRKVKKKFSDSDTDDDLEEEPSDDSESDIPLSDINAAKRGSAAPIEKIENAAVIAADNFLPAVPKTGETTTKITIKKMLKSGDRPIWSDTDSDNDYPDFDPAESESDGEDRKNFELPAPKLLPIKLEPQLEEDIEEHDEFEYTNANDYVNADFNIKSEDELSIFNEKDKLLDNLLNVDGRVKLEDGGILDETEVVLIKDESSQSFTEEDILDIKDLKNSDLGTCKIVLKDITLRYPKLKEESTVKVPRNATPFFGLTKSERRQRASSSSDKPVRKYRKRGEPKVQGDNGPKRMAKLSHIQLKERLNMLKKEEKCWSCPHCIKIYYMRKPYERHLRDDHKRPEEEIKDLFKIEEVAVVDDEIFKCNVCDKIYLVEKRLLAHVKLHGPDGTLIYKCPCYCSLYFASKEEATAHAQQNHRDLLFCEICQKFMTGHDSLKNHMKNYHSEKSKRDTAVAQQRNLVCDKCGKKFTGRTSLSDHVRSDCGRKPLYQCNICGKHLTTAGILKTHLLLHKDDTPFQCDKCGKTFKVKAQYKTHIKTRHTDYKPYKCHLCPKEYPYRESLLTHMTVHTGIKRFLCNGCGKRFTCISNLQAHRKVHAETCGALPLNAKATQYMGVQKGNLLLGAKPEAGLDYQETNTLIAREVIDRDLPMAQELNYPSEPSAPLATVPLNYSQPAPPTPAPPLPMPVPRAPTLMLPVQMLLSEYIDESHSSSYN